MRTNKRQTLTFPTAALVSLPAVFRSSTFSRIIRSLLALQFLTITACSLTAPSAPPPGKLAYPNKAREHSTRSLTELHGIINELSPTIGSYPPKIESQVEKQFVYNQWADAFVDAMAFNKKLGDSERVLWTGAELARQGHNIDVDNASYVAMGLLERCLRQFPNSQLCHQSSAEFYSSVRPTDTTLAKLERSLVFLRKQTAKKPQERVEEKFISLYAERGEKQSAIKQIDRFLKLFPKTKLKAELKRFRTELKA